MKRGDDNDEFLAVETEEERRTRLENDAILKSWQLCLSFKLDVLTT